MGILFFVLLVFNIIIELEEVVYMPNASLKEIEEFRINYCQSQESRLSIINDFTVLVASFEELLPDKKVTSYAFGGKPITKAFMIFKVSDDKSHITYFPVFSESVGRKMLRHWGMVTPPKMRLFVDDTRGSDSVSFPHMVHPHTNENNRNLRLLIVFARSMMILHSDEPQPMHGVFKDIYDSLLSNSTHDVSARQIKCINTAIMNYLNSKTNLSKERFTILGDYIDMISKRYKQKIVKYNFEKLRQLFIASYPEHKLYF